MKKVMWLVLMFGCGGATTHSATPSPDVTVSDSTADEAAAPDPKVDTSTGLSTKQAKAVLTATDDACGDAWCEGDYDWKFLKIACNFSAKSCTLTVQVAPLADDPKSEKWVWRACKMAGIAGYSAMLDANQSLQSDFYDKLDTCMTKIQTGLSTK